MFLFLACLANSLSASSPCLSPLPSFLKAYCTLISLLSMYWPSKFATAASLLSKSPKLTNPNPLLFPEWSRATFGRLRSGPKREKVSYNSFSSTMASRLPMKSSAPISAPFCLSADALFTRSDFPKSFIPFMTFAAYSASEGVRNSTKPKPWWVWVTRSRGMWML